MSYEILRVLGNWSVTSHGAEVTRVVDPAGFSGAVVWRVEADGQTFALKQWPKHVHGDRLRLIHTVQSQAAAHGPPVIPILLYTYAGSTYAACDGCRWDLATWRPGAADYWQNPRPQRLASAMGMLAAIHNAIQQSVVTPWPIGMEMVHGRESASAARRRSPSVEFRSGRLAEIVHGDWKETASRAVAASSQHQPIASEVVALIQQLAPRELDKAIYWRAVDLPLQFRLGDVRQDHVLFTGDEVTGVIDFGAVDYDSPAADVARLLGDLVSDDHEAWQRGLDAYVAVHPLSDIEIASADFFYSSGVMLAAANWIEWLWGDSKKRLRISDYTRPVARLARLVDRLRRLGQ